MAARKTKKTAKKKAKKRPAKKRVQKKVAKKATNKGGRPTKYTPALAARICAALASGKSMRSVCADPKMPAMSTVFLWLANDERFSEQYEKAKQECADLLVEDIIEIADDGRNDYFYDEVLRKLDEDMTVGELLESNSMNELRALLAKHRPEHVQRSRLRVDARKFVAAKLKPKKYGDKAGEPGSDPDLPVYNKIEHVIKG